MKFSSIGIIAVMLVVTALLCAGCTSSTTTTPPASAAPAAAGASPTGAAAAAGTASPGAVQSAAAPAAAPASGSSAAGGASLFGGLSYNFVEYKIATGSGNQAMTIYFKYDKAGKCSMRFEGPAAAQLPAGMASEQDCSAKGGQAQANPNQVSSDAQVTCSPVDETVTVPAGTFTATKCTVTANGATETAWVVKNKFLVKMQGSSPQGGSVDMELNSYG